MHLTLTPQRGLPGQAETTITVAGDTLIVSGTPYDLSAVPEGGEATADDSPFIGKITRQGGKIHATVLVVLGDTAADDQGTDPWVIPNASDDVSIPAIRKPEVTE